MKITSIERELNTDQIYIHIYCCFKIYNKKLLKKGECIAKNCQKINTENIFMNFEIMPLKVH